MQFLAWSLLKVILTPKPSPPHLPSGEALRAMHPETGFFHSERRLELQSWVDTQILNRNPSGI